MSATWYGKSPPPSAPSFGWAGWLRVFVKGILIALLVLGGLAILLLCRVFERPIFGTQRPFSPAITVFVCKNALRIIGLHLTVEGRVADNASALVANHSSWLDIFVLNAVARVYFVSKAEVAGWPLIGWLARATGTVFIERNRAKAAEQSAVFRDRLEDGHRLLFFPEGTSSDGSLVLPFKTTLFSPFLNDQIKSRLFIQPMSVRYHAPANQDARFYGWWGDMTFGSHFLVVLATAKQGRATVICHPPIDATRFQNRKTLGQAAEDAVRYGHDMLAPQADLPGQ